MTYIRNITVFANYKPYAWVFENNDLHNLIYPIQSTNKHLMTRNSSHQNPNPVPKPKREITNSQNTRITYEHKFADLLSRVFSIKDVNYMFVYTVVSFLQYVLRADCCFLFIVFWFCLLLQAWNDNRLFYSVLKNARGFVCINCIA